MQVDLGFAAGVGVADADGVNHYPFGGRHAGGVVRGDRAAGVVAVGEQDQHFLRLMGLVEHLQGQANGIADGGVGAGHADAGVVQQQRQAGVVQSQWRLRVGAAAKHDQAEAVFLAPVDKAVDHFLDCGQAVDLLPVGVGVVGGFHGLGYVDRQHQVAHRLLALDGFFHQHRARNGGDQQGPDQPVEQQLPAVAEGAGLARCLADGAAHGAEKRHPHRTAGFAIVRQVAIAQPDRGEQQPQPRVVKLPHDDAPPSVCRC
ncbi:hypothetical protein D3C85_940760 [compost metagenome]